MGSLGGEHSFLVIQGYSLSGGFGGLGVICPRSRGTRLISMLGAEKRLEVRELLRETFTDALANDGLPAIDIRLGKGNVGH